MTRLVDPELCATSYGVLNCGGSIVGGLGALADGWMRQRMDFSRIPDVAGLGVFAAVFGRILLSSYSHPRRC